MFSFDKRLRYEPFRRYELPYLWECSVQRFRQLIWPGVGAAQLPPSFIKRFFGDEALEAWEEASWRGLIPHLPKRIPPALAYHIMVSNLASPPHPGFAVAGLPPEAVRFVLGSVHDPSPDEYAAIVYLASLATSHRAHPILSPFDTVVREELSLIGACAAEKFFFLLGDCLLERDPLWSRLACYLHWVGRTGAAHYDHLSGIDEECWQRIEKRFPGTEPNHDTWGDWRRDPSPFSFEGLFEKNV